MKNNQVNNEGNNEGNNSETYYYLNSTLMDLIKLRSELKSLKIKYENELNILIDKIKKNEDDIMKSCDHHWITDPNYSPAPYERPDHLCTICGSIKYRW